MRTRPNYESDPEWLGAAAYRVAGYGGIAWACLGWETQPDEDTEWTGIEPRTGKVVCVMIGDDRRFCFEPELLKPLQRAEYCSVCGQIGCAHDGYDRSEE